MSKVTPRPFLKWVGGKGQLLEQLQKRLPKSFNNYHEPFLGGGALFFGMYRAGKIKQAYLSDLNEELIDAYTVVRDNVDALLSLLVTYPHDEDFFYELRGRDPWAMSRVERAARMIYLNKTCYNGLYRVNKKGQFNAPFGRYKNPKFHDPENLLPVSAALQNVSLKTASFTNVLDNAQERDFVYFDPPYAPLSSTSNFTAYNAAGFSEEAQGELRDVCLQLAERGVHVMISNSSTKVIKDLYKGEAFTMRRGVKARRSINSNATKRGKLSEVIVKTY